MFLDPFHQHDGNTVVISGEQGSRFAKDIAGDFNPIHNPDSKRFCVPGDLLFALVLCRFGLYPRMRFRFAGMVDQDTPLCFPETDDARFDIHTQAGRPCLEVEREGECSLDMDQIEPFVRGYVAFSGHNFPDILVPLMAEQNVMINIERPLVIYESMSFDFDHLHFSKPTLRLAETTLDVRGKRGDALLTFEILSDGERVGTGVKKLVLSGLREYEQAVMDRMVQGYADLKESDAARKTLPDS